MVSLILALDFGGTKHTAALIGTGERAWRAHRRLFSPPEADAAYDWRTMLGLAETLLAGERPSVIGVSFGGPVDSRRGIVRLSHHVPGWESAPLAERLSRALGAPACVDNDANAAALGEYRYGAGQGADSLLYVTVSTGVGGGWVLNGRLWHGHDGLAGEIGHTVVDPAGPRCLCGKQGCVERLASGPYMASDARERLAAMGEGARGGESGRDRSHLWQLAGGDPATITGQLVATAAAAGDPLAAELLGRGAWALGVGLGNAANLLNPARILLGGGVTKAGDAWWAEVRRAARATALPEVSLAIEPAVLGDDAPLWGAVALAESYLAGDGSASGGR